MSAMSMTANPVVGAGMQAVVVGLGRSGRAAALLLARHGVRVIATDSGRPAGTDELADAGIEVQVGGHSPVVLDGTELVVVSPGVPLDAPLVAEARRRRIPVLGELGLSLGFVDLPLVAITGTNGKSTVTTLVGDMLRAAGRSVFVGGNLGTPLAEYLLEGAACDVLVLEVSSFQLDTVGHIAPAVAVLLNVSPDHLDRYESYAAYVASKKRLFRDQTEGQAAVLNGDDPACAEVPGRARRLYFSGRRRDVAGRIEADRVLVEGLGELILPPSLALGPNPANVAAAALAAAEFACPVTAVQAALDGFRPLPHRMAVVAEHDGITWVDDSKATNIGAVAAALASIDRPVVLIAGGRDKGGDYRLLRPQVTGRVKAVVCIGEASERIADALENCTAVEFAADMEEAVRRAASRAAAGDVVLLSPACASFDMYASYAERGRVFQTAVADLVGGGGWRHKTMIL